MSKRILWSKDKLSFIKEQYESQKMNTYQLAEHFGCSNDTISRKLKAMNIQPRKFHEDLTGKKIGKLTVLGVSDKTNRRLYWKCQCDCGKIISVKGDHLRQKNQLSCGCLSSVGEEEIAEILRSNNINFITQYKFDNFTSDYNNIPYRFDFAIIINDKVEYLIEFDGEQHFYYQDNKSFWNTKESYIKTQELDKKKNCYCKNNNIPLIRIPYTLRGKIKIEDLLLKTTQFLVKE